MAGLDNLGQGNLADMQRRLRALETQAGLNGSSIGALGMRVHSGGVITIENGGLSVTGTATIVGTLNADGTINMDGLFIASGEMRLNGTTIATGDFNIDGPLIVDGNTTFNGTLNIKGVTTIAGDTTVTGKLVTNGPVDINGLTKISGNLEVTGTLDIKGAATLSNNLTVASGKKIIVGGLSLENTGLSGGQVNFPGGSITASAALGMLINHATVEIAGTVVKISGLPTTTQPANLHADSSGRLYRSTAA